MEEVKDSTDWRSGTLVVSDPLPGAPCGALAAVLDVPEVAPGAGEPLPFLWHWMYFLRWPARSDCGVDGHPSDGPFMPPMPNRRRVFAGGRVHQVSAPFVGEPTERRSTLTRADSVRGRSGEFLLCTVRHEIWQHRVLCIVDEQDLAYRSGDDGCPQAVPADDSDDAVAPESSSPWQVPVSADPALLFRFSALTANTHRIHYDQRYVCEVEHYPDLVVHGPLLTLLMVDLVRRNAPDRTIASIEYRFRRPVYVSDDIVVHGTPERNGVALGVRTGRGLRAEAAVEFA